MDLQPMLLVKRTDLHTMIFFKFYICITAALSLMY